MKNLINVSNKCILKLDDNVKHVFVFSACNVRSFVNDRCLKAHFLKFLDILIWYQCMLSWLSIFLLSSHIYLLYNISSTITLHCSLSNSINLKIKFSKQNVRLPTSIHSNPLTTHDKYFFFFTFRITGNQKELFKHGEMTFGSLLNWIVSIFAFVLIFPLFYERKIWILFFQISTDYLTQNTI